LLVNDFHSEEVRKAVAPYLGKPDEISYHIGKQRLLVKRGNDGNSIRIYLLNEKDIKEDTELPESTRIW
jgi:hypothetical protein